MHILATRAKVNRQKCSLFVFVFEFTVLLKHKIAKKYLSIFIAKLKRMELVIRKVSYALSVQSMKIDVILKSIIMKKETKI